MLMAILSQNQRQKMSRINEIMDKRCTKCLKRQSVENFYKGHTSTKDGLSANCKSCVKEYQKLPHVRAAKRESQERYQRSKKGKFYQKKYRKKALANQKKAFKRIKAYRKVNLALDVGVLKKGPCVLCGKKKTHAYLENYSFPLSVTWLCSEHLIEANIL